ncbi:MAG: hypothetical protein ACRC3I_10140 [Cetobacterium sp.]
MTDGRLSGGWFCFLVHANVLFKLSEVSLICSLIDKVTNLLLAMVHLRIGHGTQYKHTINTQGQTKTNKNTTQRGGRRDSKTSREREKTQYNSRESNKTNVALKRAFLKKKKKLLLICIKMRDKMRLRNLQRKRTTN